MRCDARRLLGNLGGCHQVKALDKVSAPIFNSPLPLGNMRKHTPESGWFPVEANGQTFACLSEGEGPLVLLFHGFPDTPHCWDKTRAALAAAGYRAVSPFMRGYVPTTIPEHDDYEIDTLGADALGLISALGAERAVLVGHDWGASTVYSAAALGPEKVEALVTVGIPHQAGVKPTPSLAWAVRHFLTLKMPGAVRRFKANDFAQVEMFYRRWSPTWDLSADELEAAKNAFAAPGCANAALGYYRQLSLKPPPSSALPVHAPTMCIFGEDDPALTRDIYQKSAHIFQSTYRVEPCAGGHWAHQEDSEKFIGLLLSFLKESLA